MAWGYFFFNDYLVSWYGGYGALRQLLTAPGVDLVAVNDLADAATLAHLLKYDSVHGQWPIPVAVDGNDLLLDRHRIRVFNEAHPSRIPFGASGAQVGWNALGPSPTGPMRRRTCAKASVTCSSAPRPRTPTARSSWA